MANTEVAYFAEQVDSRLAWLENVSHTAEILPIASAYRVEASETGSKKTVRNFSEKVLESAERHHQKTISSEV